ncbi:MAG: hypothetical protein HN899_12750 [Gemmatimonadales bacterium]|nr:hypothetical protein [Gemmatimonadales bacterium]
MTFRGAVLIVLAVLSGCGSRSSEDPFNGQRSAPSQIRINVDNQNFNDVRLFSLTTRGRMLLGQVGGNAQRTFQVDWRGLDEIRVRMEFLAGADYETNRVDVSPGEQIYLMIPSEPRNAYLRRR